MSIQKKLLNLTKALIKKTLSVALEGEIIFIHMHQPNEVTAKIKEKELNLTTECPFLQDHKLVQERMSLSLIKESKVSILSQHCIKIRWQEYLLLINRKKNTQTTYLQ